ncbi:MAG: hypothetical protein HRF45_03210 [Fimbriimonadia bacterium]|jgi:hypothetical protein
MGTGIRTIVFSSLVLVAGSALAAGSAADHYNRYEWRANTFTPSAQDQATIAVAPDGQITVAWGSRRQLAGRSGVYYQKFSPDGIALGGEQPVGIWTESHLGFPALASAPSGETWAVWQSWGQDGHGSGVLLRKLDGGDEILVNQTWKGDQSDPAIAIDQQGRIAVVWRSLTSSKANPRVYVRLFDSAGRPLTEEIPMSGEDRFETTPALAWSADGSLAVVFAVFDAAREPAGIHLQRFRASGERIGTDILVSGEPKNSQVEPVIAATRRGYVVAWQDAESDGSDYGVIARRLDLRGEPISAPFVVNSTTAGVQNGADIAVAPDGHFAIAWNSEDGDRNGVFVQMFASDGTRLGGEVRLNDRTDGDQSLRAATGSRRVAFLPDGRLVCAWSGNGPQDKNGTYVSMLSRRSLSVNVAEMGVTPVMQPAAPKVVADAASPHIPPTFDPLDVEQEGEREVTIAGADIGFLGITSTGWTPPDPHLAVGPNHIVVMTNGAIAWFTKTGTKQYQTPIEGSTGFWGSLGATGFVFDPEVLYDELSGRFFAMAAEGYAPNNKSYVLVAVSDDSDPNGTWYKYRFDTSALAGNLFDSPNIAVDQNVVYVTGDGFGIGANYPVYTFDKASLLAGLPPAISKSTTLSTTTQSAGMPPVSFDNPPYLYLIEHQEGSSRTQVRLLALKNPLTSPTFVSVNLTVPAYSSPGTPVQKGTTVRPQTFDARFWSVAYRNGHLWAAHHVNSNPVESRWYEIDMRGWPDSGLNPVLVQSGTAKIDSAIHTFFNSITVDPEGNAAMTFARSSSNEYISMVTTHRWASDALGTMGPHVIRKDSTGPYTTDRWGDYSAINVDPADHRTFWAHHEWASGGWRTWIQGFKPEATMTGAVTLQNLVPSPAGRVITLEFRQPSTLNVVASFNAVLDGSGGYTVPDVLTGTYDIALKHGTWLRQVRPSQVVAGPATSGVNFTLRNGDVNDDNSVDISDLTLVLTNFGGTMGPADLNADGSVDLSDLNIILTNFGVAGDL